MDFNKINVRSLHELLDSSRESRSTSNHFLLIAFLKHLKTHFFRNYVLDCLSRTVELLFGFVLLCGVLFSFPFC